jgi:hypothetical protein
MLVLLHTTAAMSVTLLNNSILTLSLPFQKYQNSLLYRGAKIFE